MTDMLKALQEKTKELNTGTHSAKTNLISKLNNLGVTKATSDLDLPELVQLIGFSAVEDKMPTILTLSADKTTVSSGDTVTLTATLTDVNGCPISGETVSILDGDDNVLYTGIIDENGQISFQYSSTIIGNKTFKITLQNSTNYINNNNTITILIGEPVNLTLTRTPTTYNFAGSTTDITSKYIPIDTTFTITSTLTDTNNNPLTNKTVTFLKNNVEYSTKTTDSNGQANITYSSSVVEDDNWIVSFLSDGVYVNKDSDILISSIRIWKTFNFSMISDSSDVDYVSIINFVPNARMVFQYSLGNQHIGYTDDNGNIQSIEYYYKNNSSNPVVKILFNGNDTYGPSERLN